MFPSFKKGVPLIPALPVTPPTSNTNSYACQFLREITRVTHISKTRSLLTPTAVRPTPDISIFNE